MKGFGIEIKNNLLEPKHIKKMGSAVWFYMWLVDKITSVDEEGIGKILGGKPVKYPDVKKELGISQATYTRWVSKLLEYPYIIAIRTPHGISFRVLKAYKRFGRKTNSDSSKTKSDSAEVRNVRDSAEVRNVNKDSNSLDNNKDNNNNIAAKPQDVVNYFFELKGWANKEKDFYKKNKIIYSRHMKPAKELLVLCDGELKEAKACLNKIKNWAEDRNLSWAIETVFKKWHELDYLKPKEKKPYYNGRRIFQKTRGGRWYIISLDGEIKELGTSLRENQISWK